MSVGLAVRGHGHVPREAVGVRASARDRLRDDLVEAPEAVLTDRHGGGLRARIAHEIRHGVVRRAPRRARRLPQRRLDRHVERVADLESQVGARARVADAVLADELRLAARVARIDAHDAARQLIAETARLRVRETHAHLRRNRLLLREEVVERLLVTAVGAHALGRQEADLLRLVVRDRRLLRERINVVVGELLASARLDSGAPHVRVVAADVIDLPPLGLAADDVDVARDELRARVRERRPGGVRQRDPALQRHVALRFLEHGDIVGAPREATRKIGQRDVAVHGYLGVREH